MKHILQTRREPVDYLTAKCLYDAADLWRIRYEKARVEMRLARLAQRARHGRLIAVYYRAEEVAHLHIARHALRMQHKSLSLAQEADIAYRKTLNGV